MLDFRIVFSHRSRVGWCGIPYVTYETARNCRFSWPEYNDGDKVPEARLAAFNYHVNHHVTEKYITGG